VTVNQALLDLLVRQDGLVTVDQAQRFGLPARTLRRRVSADGWARVAPRVVLAGGHPWSDRARIRAAALWAGDRAAVSGPPRPGGTACCGPRYTAGDAPNR
jgi:hypothetical protein